MYCAIIGPVGRKQSKWKPYCSFLITKQHKQVWGRGEGVGGGGGGGVGGEGVGAIDS